ncbi:MAG: hypothetical protein JSS95_05850 [Acidobacteria bacterium]|nr:hypothetical protein [Acidobacteriota bacterium]
MVLILRTKLVFSGILLAAQCGLALQASGQSQIARQSLVTVSVSDSTAGPEEGVTTSTYWHSSRPSAVTQPRSSRGGPFSSVTITAHANTLGAGIEVATPLSHSFGLRGQGNFFSFDYLFNIDGVDYDSRLNLRSGGLSLDWYPTHHSFRVSPGVLYYKNNLTAISSVPAGNYFELGSQGFINSVDDPLNGNATVIFPHHMAPMITVGFNLLGKRESRFSIPLEFGAAYTGAAKIDVTLNGTACTNEGCFTFAKNQEAQTSLQEEIKKLNNDLESYPIYPIVSIGFAYRFGR